MILLYILSIYALHELGHLAAIYLLRAGRVTGIALSWKAVGITWHSGGDLRKQVAVSLAGPLVNLILFGICGLTTFGLCNLAFGVLNLVLPGGDGVKIL